ncbi:MAG: hypothetical protein WDA20_14195 [Desulfuromonadales bacterium]
MVAEPRTWVDVESAVRAWLRQALPSLDGRAFFGFSNDAPLPQVVLTRITGPDDRCVVQFDCWAETKAGAAVLAADVATAIDVLARYVDGETVLHAARIEGIRWQPDIESDTPRYVVEATFTASSRT